MLKLLIVDDFFYDREAAKEFFDNGELPIEVIGIAENAMQALDKISFYLPDILLTDIEMPGMNGIELTRIVKERFPNIKVVFMSCYSEFEYAKKALNLDVSAYITKPLIKKDIYEVFLRVCALIAREIQIDEDRKNLKKRLEESLPLLRERFLRNLFLGVKYEESKLWEQIQHLNIPLRKEDLQLILIEVDDYEQVQRDLSIEENQLLIIRLSDIIEKAKHDIEFNIGLILTQIDEKHVIIAINYYQLGSALEKEIIGVKLADNIRELLDNSDLPSMTIAIGEVFYDIMKVNLHYIYCLNAMKHKFFTGKGALINLKEIPQEYNSLYIDLNEMKQDLKKIILSESEELVPSFIARYFDKIHKGFSEDSVKNLIFSIIMCLQLLLEEFNLNYETIFGEDMILWKKIIDFKTILDTRQWVSNILIIVKKWIINRNKNKSKKIIEEIKKYIETNFNKELTVQIISKEMYFSPNYLNLLFKNETGETIPDFISRVRVEKAKILLKDPKLKLYDIVEMVGYRHLPHFNIIFKSYTGMTLKEFKEYI